MRLARRYPLCDPGHHTINKQLHVATVQEPPDSPLPPVHSRLHVGVHVLVLCSLVSSFASGPTGIRWEIGPPSVFIVDRVVEEDCRMLLVNELQSMTLPDSVTPALSTQSRHLRSSRTSAFWVTECSRNSYNSTHTTRHLLSSWSRAYSQATAKFSAACVSPYLLPTGDLYASNCPQETLILSTYRAVILLLQYHLFPLLLKPLSECVASRGPPGPEQQPLHGVGSDQRDQRAPRGRGHVRAADQRRRDGWTLPSFAVA